VSDYLHPDIPAGTRVHDVPLVHASRAALKGFGEIVRDPKTHKIEIVTWPAKGWRKLDDNTGNEGGTTEVLHSPPILWKSDAPAFRLFEKNRLRELRNQSAHGGVGVTLERKRIGVMSWLAAAAESTPLWMAKLFKNDLWSDPLRYYFFQE